MVSHGWFYRILPKSAKVVNMMYDNTINDGNNITEYSKKYSKQIAKQILLSQKDVGNVEILNLSPVYMLPFILEDL